MVDIQDTDAGTLVGESEGERSAHAAARPGDHNPFSCDTSRHHSPFEQFRPGGTAPDAGKR
jgi:hypothetical protein